MRCAKRVPFGTASGGNCQACGLRYWNESTIDNGSVIIFSKAFYEALGQGESFVKAFELGKNAIELHNQGDFSVPILIEHSKEIRVTH
jgi:predicted RNase H-like HicB family nuclease